MDSKTLIKLDLCGKIFEVEKSVLLGSDFFKTMFEDCDLNDAVIKIGRSAHIFKHVLAFLIDRSYAYPKKYESELKYYLIEYSANKLYDPNGKINTVLSTILELKYELEKMKCIMKDEETECCHTGCDRERIYHPVTCKEHLGICAYYRSFHDGRAWDYDTCSNECATDEKYCSVHSSANEST